MDVIVTKLAFWNNARVYPGQKLELPDGTKGKWFEPANAKKGRAKAKPEDGEQNADDLV